MKWKPTKIDGKSVSPGKLLFTPYVPVPVGQPPVQLLLTVDTDDENVITCIERVARENGIHLERVEE